MTNFTMILCVLIVFAVFLAPLIWDLLRENNRLQNIVDQSDYFRMACEDASDGILIQDMKGRILWANPAYARIHGMAMNEIIGRNPLEFALPDDQKPSDEAIATFQYDPEDPAVSGLELVKNVDAFGKEFWNQINVSFRKSEDGRQNAILVCRDVTDQVEQENILRDIGLKLEHQASHDGLTGVPNRAAFMSFFRAAVQMAGHPPVGLLHIDLDEFKSVNDTHGHSAGDAVLIHTAETLQNSIAETDLIARVGGDEFVIVYTGLTQLAQLERLANDLIEQLSHPISWNNRVLQNGASIGAAFASGKLTNAEDILVRADFALYQAKREGRNRVAVYDGAMREKHDHLHQRSIDLIAAVDADALDYFFQPTMDLHTGQIIGFETLVRWNHPTDGIIAPDQFLPLAKDLGLMGALDLLSLTAALDEKRRLASAGYPDIKVAFNASPDLLNHPQFMNRLTWGVDAHGIKRSDITIEVLETTDFGDPSQTSSHASVIQDLRRAGFPVHLDDFGVGFAGLSHLASLNVSGVKVDRSLVNKILIDETSQKIVRKIIELSNDLGLCVIAEGVEDEQTAHTLRDMGCNVIQGYWLSRPLPHDAVLSWLAKRGKTDQTNIA